MELFGSLSLGGNFHCPTCHKDITAGEYPQKVEEEILWMNKLGDEDFSDPEDSGNRGISVKFLVEFCIFFNLWDVSSRDVRSKYVIPMTSPQRCRFVDLPMLVEAKVVGPARTFISHSWSGKFGDLVAAASDRAEESTMVWIDIFAVRQWPSTKNDLNFQVVIERCASLLIVCPSIPEVRQLLVDMSNLSAQLKTRIPFLRVWCLYEIFYAAKNNINIDVKGGSFSFKDNGKHFFAKDISILKTMASIIDIDAASATNAADRTMIFGLIESFDGGVSGMNDMVQEVLKLACCRLEDNDLHCAARTGDIAYIQKWVLECKDVNARDNYGLTVLHAAADSNQLSTVQYLLSRKADIAIGDKNGSTAVHFAARSGSLSCLQCLLENGANKDARDKEGQSALHIVAVSRYRFACLKYLVSCGADLALMDNNGRNVLHRACASGRLPFVEYLVSHGANVDVKDNMGDSALHYSVNDSGNLTCFQHLVANGAQVLVRNGVGNALLHHAVLKGSVAFVQHLLGSVRVDVNAMNASGDTALSIAKLLLLGGGCSSGSSCDDKEMMMTAIPVIINLLESHGADVSITPSKYHPFHYAAKTADVLARSCLLSLDADIINIADRAGCTALHFAADSGSLPCLKYLLESGADVHAADDAGRSALHYAAHSSNSTCAVALVAATAAPSSCVQYLLEQGAQTNCVDNNGLSALHCAFQSDNLQSFEQLLSWPLIDCNVICSPLIHFMYKSSRGENFLSYLDALHARGADVNIRDGRGMTLLQHCGESEDMPLFEYLISQHGADVNTLSHTDEHLSHYFYNHSNTGLLLSFVKYLISHGANINSSGKYFDSRGRTLLHAAAARGDLSFVDFLVSAGANVNIKDNIRGISALQLAVYEDQRYVSIFVPIFVRHRSCVEYLIAHGADDINFDCGRLLHGAAKDGDSPFVTYLVSHNADVNIIGSDGFPPLYSAAAKGHRSCVEILIAHGADVNTNRGFLLQEAAKSGDMSFIEYLISHNADVNMVGMSGFPPLYYAAAKGHRCCVEYLISKGADVTIMQDGWGDLLIQFARSGNLPWVDFIVSHACLDDVDSSARYKTTALHSAASGGYRPCVECLIAHGADVNAFIDHYSHHTLLYRAAKTGDLSFLEYLISRGANVNIGNGYPTALCSAVSGGHHSCVEYLILHGADANIFGDRDDPPLHTAIKEQDLQMVKLLCSSSTTNITLVNRYGCTPMYSAVRRGNLSCVKYLVEKGANVQNDELLQVAARNGHLGCVDYLVMNRQQGDDVVSDSNYENLMALHCTAASGHLECVKYLINRVTDAYVPDSNGNTAIHLAVDGNHLDCLQLLLSHTGAHYCNISAPIHAKNRNGNTAVYLAARRGHLPCFECLVAHGADVNVSGEDGNNPFHLCAINGFIECGSSGSGAGSSSSSDVAALYERIFVHLNKSPINKTDFEARNHNGQTALHCAILSGRMACVKFLVFHGASVNAVFNGTNPRSLAANCDPLDKLGIIRYLADHGAIPQPNSYTYFG